MYDTSSNTQPMRSAGTLYGCGVCRGKDPHCKKCGGKGAVYVPFTAQMPSFPVYYPPDTQSKSSENKE